MAKVLTHMCMSLDGFFAQPDDNPAELFEWCWDGDVAVPSAQEAMSFSVDAASAAMLRELTSGCGAGRRPANVRPDRRLGRQPPRRSTRGRRDPPADARPRRRTVSANDFPGSVEQGIATAKEIAGDKFVTIASADIIQQALNLGLVDKPALHQVPVLFGTGIRYFGHLVGDHVMLEDAVVVQCTRALHLRYPVRL